MGWWGGTTHAFAMPAGSRRGAGGLQGDDDDPVLQALRASLEEDSYSTPDELRMVMDRMDVPTPLRLALQSISEHVLSWYDATLCRTSTTDSIVDYVENLSLHSDLGCVLMLDNK